MRVGMFDPMYGDGMGQSRPQVPFDYPESVLGDYGMQGPVLPPDWGPDNASGGDGQGMANDPLAPLKAQVDAARQAYMDSIMGQGDVPPFQMSQPPGMTGLQAGIGGLLGAIGAASGPNGNGAGIAGQYAHGVMDFNTRKWQAAMENMKAVRQSEIDRKKLRAQVAQLDYEDKAREHGQQAQFRHQEQAGDKAYQRQLGIGEQTYQRQLDVAKAKSAGQLALEDKRLKGDPEAAIMSAYLDSQSTATPMSRDQLLDALTKVGPSKAGQLGAQAKLLTNQAEEVLSRSGLEKARTDEIRERIKWIRPEKQARIAYDYARIAKLKQAPAQGAKGTATAPALRASYNSLIKSLNDEITEAETSVTFGAQGIIGLDHVVELKAQRDSLVDELELVNQGVINPKATAPK